MVKTIISILCAVLILTVGALYEDHFVHKQFDDFHQVLDVLYEKIENLEATESDVLAVQDNWLIKKKNLHAFIPHTEIKEVDLWLSETVTLVKDEQWTDALSKVEVLKELAEQIPKTFEMSFQNIL